MRVGSATGIATSSSRLPDESGPITNSLSPPSYSNSASLMAFPRMEDRGIADPVLCGPSPRFPRRYNLTNAGVKEYLTGALEQVLLDWGRTRLRQTRPSRNLRHFAASARSQPSWGSTEPLNQHAETAKRSPLRQSVYHGWSGGSPTRSLRANCLKVGRQQDRRLAGRKSQQIPAVLVGLDDIDLDAGPPHPTLRCPAGGPTSFSALTWISIGVRVEPLACTARMSVRSSPSRVSAGAQPYRARTEQTQCSPALLVILVSATGGSLASITRIGVEQPEPPGSVGVRARAASAGTGREREKDGPQADAEANPEEARLCAASGRPRMTTRASTKLVAERIANVSTSVSAAGSVYGSLVSSGCASRI